MTCCGHARYIFIAINGVRHAQCADCSGQWRIILSDPLRGSTDDIRNDASGVQARVKR